MHLSTRLKKDPFTQLGEWDGADSETAIKTMPRRPHPWHAQMLEIVEATTERGLFTYCNLIEDNLDKNILVLSAFHTIEFFILMLCLSALYPGVAYVIAGMALHMVTDLYHISVTLRRPFARAFSLVEYIYKSRTDNFLTSVKELVQQDNLNV